MINLYNSTVDGCSWRRCFALESTASHLSAPFSPSPRVPLRQALSPAQNSPDRKIRGARNKIPEGRETENSSRSSRSLATVGRTLSSMIRVVFSSLLVHTGHTPMRSVPVSHIETVRHIFTYYILIAFSVTSYANAE